MVYYKIIDETTDMIVQNGEEKILHRKPAFADTFALVNDLQYAPEWREGNNAKNRRLIGVEMLFKEETEMSHVKSGSVK